MCCCCSNVFCSACYDGKELNSHMFFSTLTYDNDHLPYIDTSSGYRYRYADFHHLQLMFKRIRKV